MHKKIRTLIIGAGPSGIAAALQLGNDAIVIDKNPFAGGQSSSIEIGEAVFRYRWALLPYATSFRKGFGV